MRTDFKLLEKIPAHKGIKVVNLTKFFLRMPSKFLRFICKPGPDQIPIVTLSRQDLWLAFGLAGLVILLGAWQMVIGVCGVYHDDAIYVITAKALAQGEGYRLINLPGEPLQTKYPILYPALLAIIWKIWPSFPENLLAMQWLNLIAGAISVGLAYLYLVRFNYFSRWKAIAAGLLSATSPQIINFSLITMSESIFLLFFIIALWFIENNILRPYNNNSIQIVLGIILALPMLCRIIGFVFVPIALLIVYFSGRRIRYILVGTTLVVLPYFFWVVVVPKFSQDITLLYYNNYLGWWSALGMQHIVRLILYNLLYTLIGVGTLCQDFLSVFLRIFKVLSLIIIIPLGVAVMMSILRGGRYFRLLPCCLLAYIGVMLIWPWQPYRFIIPIVPFLLVYVINFLSEKLSRFFNPRNSYVMGCAILILFFITNISFAYHASKICRKYNYPYPWFLTLKSKPVSWGSYEKVFVWIKQNTKSTDILACGFDSMLFLYSDRYSFRPYVVRPMSLFYFVNEPPLGSSGDFVKTLSLYKAHYLVKTPMPGFDEEKPLNELIEEVKINCPGVLDPVYVGDDDRFIIYKILN